MAKLTEAFMAEGRELIRSKDLPGVMRWVERSKMRIDRVLVETTMRRYFQADDTERAVRLIDKVFREFDPSRQTAALIGYALLITFVFLGLLGGVVSLIRSCS